VATAGGVAPAAAGCWGRGSSRRARVTRPRGARPLAPRRRPDRVPSDCGAADLGPDPPRSS